MARLSLSHPAPWRIVTFRRWFSRSLQEELDCGHVLYLPTGPDPRTPRRRRCGDCARDTWIDAVCDAVQRQLTHPAGAQEWPTWDMLAYLYEAYPDAAAAATRYLADRHLR